MDKWIYLFIIAVIYVAFATANALDKADTEASDEDALNQQIFDDAWTDESDERAAKHKRYFPIKMLKYGGPVEIKKGWNTLDNIDNDDRQKRYFPVKMLKYGGPVDIKKRYFPVKMLKYGGPVDIKKRYFPVKMLKYGGPVDIKKRWSDPESESHSSLKNMDYGGAEDIRKR